MPVLSKKYFSASSSVRLRTLYHRYSVRETRRTFFCVDVCEEVAYRDSACLTVLFTETAADTSYLAYIHQCFTFFIRITLNERLLLVRNQFDQMFRTGSYTFAAGLAGFFVYDCNTVHDVDRVKGAGSHAGAITEAPVCTAFRAA